MNNIVIALGHLLGTLLQCKAICMLKKLLIHLQYYNSNAHQTCVLFRNTNFIIVNKNYDTMINSNDCTELTVQTFLRKNYPFLVNTALKHEFFFVHRLDYATSGVVCIALNKKACREASSAFQNRNTKKYYLALLRGHVSREIMCIHQPIGEDKNSLENHKMCTPELPSCQYARNAQTKILVLEFGYYDNYPATKVLLKPVTGRRHQLRVHCTHLGNSIVGDFTYSNKKDTTPDRMYLHSLRLILPVPTETLDVQTEDPFTNTKVKSWCPFYILNDIDDKTFSRLDEECVERTCNPECFPYISG